MIFWLIILSITLIALFLAVPHFSKNRWIACSILILIPLASFTIYLTSERYSQWRQYLHFQQEMTTAKTEIQQTGQPRTLIHQLKKKVKRSPNDPKAWYFLGKLYLSTHQYTKAHQAFTQAQSLDPHHQEVQFLAIQAAFFMRHSLTPEEKNFLEAHLKKQPESISVLDLLATNAYQTRNNRLAIQYWEQVLKYLPHEATADRQAILNKIAQAKNKLKAPPGQR